jgi:hypothetical protein
MEWFVERFFGHFPRARRLKLQDRLGAALLICFWVGIIGAFFVFLFNIPGDEYIFVEYGIVTFFVLISVLCWSCRINFQKACEKENEKKKLQDWITEWDKKMSAEDKVGTR